MNIVGVDDLTVTLGVVIALAALIVTLWNAIKAIREMARPAKDLVQRVVANSATSTPVTVKLLYLPA